jgi:type IV pilus assembly protein PilV
MSLIEVLVAVLIFSIGLLGLIGLQARATQFSMSAEDTNRAALLANEVVASLWLNAPPGGLPGNPSLSPAVVAAWQARIANAAADGLPNGVGTVVIVGDLADVTITWRPPTAPVGAADNRYMTQVRLRWP